MKTLLWKEFRQNSRLLLASVIFLAVPYVLALVVALVNAMSDPRVRENTEGASYVSAASLGSMFIAVILCSFIAGNAFAGERVDRSAEFVGYLPIRRSYAVGEKAILCVGACALFFLVNIVTLLLSRWPSSGTIGPFLCSGLLVFGVSWLASSFMRSPAIAAMSGLSVIMVLFVVSLIFEAQGIWKSHDGARWFVIVGVLLGPIGFIAGCVHYSRRIEP